MLFHKPHVLTPEENAAIYIIIMKINTLFIQILVRKVRQQDWISFCKLFYFCEDVSCHLGILETFNKICSLTNNSHLGRDIHNIILDFSFQTVHSQINLEYSKGFSHFWFSKWQNPSCHFLFSYYKNINDHSILQACLKLTLFPCLSHHGTKQFIKWW